MRTRLAKVSLLHLRSLSIVYNARWWNNLEYMYTDKQRRPWSDSSPVHADSAYAVRRQSLTKSDCKKERKKNEKKERRKINFHRKKERNNLEIEKGKEERKK